MQDTKRALTILRNDLSGLNFDSDRLHFLSRCAFAFPSSSLTYLELTRINSSVSLVMCSEAAELRRRAVWDGANGESRRRLLVHLQSEFLPTIPVAASVLTRSLPSRFRFAYCYASSATTRYSSRTGASSSTTTSRFPFRFYRTFLPTGRCRSSSYRDFPCSYFPNPSRAHRRSLASSMESQRRVSRNSWKR